MQKYFPLIINIFFILLFFIQICTMSIMFIPSEGNILFEILNYLKNTTIFCDIMTKSNFILIFTILFAIIIFDFIYYFLKI